ncbi:glycosyltransferase [Bradyrhizobium manausense]|uniref:glycosyltransferase family 2 protein n=1 Tax=Bradyrhizobium TaxID=374 RepID=UPI001BAA72A3|nr:MULTISPECIES: glycosyltransferase family 2 protein [Bradyrhizobium]MBR0830515.1 glycosyltransferase [Bradyrhizobium manausense]UVO28253.1 glycosyltransferase family 2 protein [Bradyrhizobium arachidis]
MREALQWIADSSWTQFALAVIIFDIPRYTLSLLSLALLGLTRLLAQGQTPVRTSVSVIVPAFNGGSGLLRSVESLRQQTLPPLEIIVVDDGSTDDTRAIAEQARAAGLVDMVICHGTRCGRSAAINAAARFASGELLLTVDADTLFEPTAVARLASAFADPRVAGASCNIAISNETSSIWTRLQGIEYLMSISAGRTILDIVGAIACLSGACSMYRRDVFVRHGGLDVGPGEDLEFSLRLRRLGYLVRFVPDAWAETAGVVSGLGLLRQRARWDRDALRIRLITYGELRFFHRFERLPDTLQRLDFILFDLIPTLSLPFYLIYLMVLLGSDAFLFLAAIYFALVWISFFNLGLAFALFKRKPSFLNLGAALLFPIYQGVWLKCARLVSYSSEIIFASSKDDDFVPPRVRRALFAESEGAHR